MLAALRHSIRFAAPAVAVTFLLAMSAPGTASVAAKSATSIPIVGSVVGGGAFSGVLNITSFAVQNGQVVAIGTVSGVVTNAAGAATSAFAAVTVPVSVGQATCDILHLDLGPLSLDILGLQVNLSRVVLDISAQTGAGNLLGNLLCAVAGLLDNPTGLAKILNDILTALLG
jgi:hypothetical protein